jgi:hypothetical protein
MNCNFFTSARSGSNTNSCGMATCEYLFTCSVLQPVAKFDVIVVLCIYIAKI